MRNRPDAVLIGAGPAAVAALLAAPPGMRIAVVTGAVPDPAVKAHAKIRAVAYERREPAGLAERLPFEGGGGSLHASAAEGGLAGYWGQQLVRYAAADPWPAELFRDHAAYLAACAEIEALFELSPASPSFGALDGGYRLATPRLAIGTPEAPDAQLLTMAIAFRRLAALRGAELVCARAARIALEDGGVSVILDDGERIEADRAILAAGVIGSLRLAMRSCPEVTAGGFRDHMPFMAYSFGVDHIAPAARADGLAHFNALTIERAEAGRTALFASVYRMGHAPMSLLLTALGLPPLMRGLPAPALADLVKPIQVWSERSRCHLRIGADGRVAVLERAAALDEDPAVSDFVGWLKEHGVRLLARGSEAGAGFHYHAAEVLAGDGGAQPLAGFLERRFSGRVSLVDAGALSAIGCRPHSLTAMAAGLVRSRRAWAG